MKKTPKKFIKKNITYNFFSKKQMKILCKISIKILIILANKKLFKLPIIKIKIYHNNKQKQCKI